MNDNKELKFKPGNIIFSCSEISGHVEDIEYPCKSLFLLQDRPKEIESIGSCYRCNVPVYKLDNVTPAIHTDIINKYFFLHESTSGGL